VLALELTRQLISAGEQVPRLTVIDAPAPLLPGAVTDAELLLWFLEDLKLGFDAGAADDVCRDRLAAAAPGDRLATALDLLNEQAGPPAPSLEELAPTWEVFRSVVRSCHAYEAQPIAADITVIRAGRDVVTEFRDHPDAGRDDWGWHRLTTGTVRTHRLPGTHHTLLADPGTLPAIAAILRS
jgi:thioesterase domain-containing protein